MATKPKKPAAKNKTSRKTKKTTFLTLPVKFSLKQLAIVATVVVAVGALVIWLAYAASPSQTEPETWTSSNSNAVTKRSSADASDGSYIEFNAPIASSTPTTTTTSVPSPPLTGKKCTVSLHGAGGGSIGSADWGRYNNQPVTLVQPRSPYGNFWLYDGPHNFQYDPNNSADETYYNDSVAAVTNSANAAGCNGAILLMGQSNGGAMAAKMYCRGFNFNGRLAGIILDDPVLDQAVLNCRSQNLKRKVYLYSDGIVNEAGQAGSVNYRCSNMPSRWYCENDTAIVRSQFEQLVGFTGIRQRANHSCTDVRPECGYVNTYESWGQQIDRFWRDFDSI